MLKKTALFVSAVCIAMSWSGVAFSCDTSILRTNVHWLKDHNRAAYSTMKSECGLLSEETKDFSHLQGLLDAYMGGLSHNSHAHLETIDGCTEADIMSAACEP